MTHYFLQIIPDNFDDEEAQELAHLQGMLSAILRGREEKICLHLLLSHLASLIRLSHTDKENRENFLKKSCEELANYLLRLDNENFPIIEMTPMKSH